MVTPAPTVPAPTSQPTPLPYSPGPLGRFLAWLETLPLSGWWVIGVVLVLAVAWSHGVQWAAGRLPTWTPDLPAVVLALYGPYALAALAVGIRVAKGAVAAFWPATGWPESEKPAWAFRFAYAPSTKEWIALLIGAAGGILALLAAPEAVLGAKEGRLAVYVAYAPLFLLGYGLSGAGFVTVFRWLRLVARIHREATAIDPFDRGPIYAFSRLTGASGLSLVVVAYGTITLNGSFQAGNLPSLAFVASSIVFAIAVFVAPLWGIHDRLTREKDALLRDAERRLSALGAAMYARVDSGDFEATKPISESISGLLVVRDRISHLQTWPWPPQLLRGFVSALLLPVVLFAISRLVGTILP